MLTNNEQITVAQSPHIDLFLQMLNEAKTPIGSVIGDDQFKTMVNAITLEVEANMVARVISHLQDIKNGNFHEN